MKVREGDAEGVLALILRLCEWAAGVAAVVSKEDSAEEVEEQEEEGEGEGAH